MLYHTLPKESPARLFPKFLCFLDLDIAQQLVLYWSGLLFMQLTQSNTEQALRRRDPSLPSLYSTDAERAAGQTKARECATNVVRSLEYFVHPDMGLTATDFLGLPVNLVYGFFSDRDLPERLWFDVIFDQISIVSPGFGDFMKAMANRGGGGKAFQQLVLKQ